MSIPSYIQHNDPGDETQAAAPTRISREPAADECDNCGEKAELFHNEKTGLAFCDRCDRWYP